LSVKKLDAATDSIFPGIEDDMPRRRPDESAEPLAGRRRCYIGGRKWLDKSWLPSQIEGHDKTNRVALSGAVEIEK